MNQNTKTVHKESNKRQKKIEGREKKAKKKAVNHVKENKSRPKNALIAILIFGVLIAMFGFSWGYNYFQKQPTIEKYLSMNGGGDRYKGMQLMAGVTADVTAKKNNMKIVMNISDDADKEVVERYAGEKSKENLEYVGAYFLGNIKPYVRGINAKATVISKKNGKEVESVTLNYSDAKKLLKNPAKEE